MFLALSNCIHISICERLSKKIDKSIRTKLMSIEKFFYFSKKLKIAGPIRSTQRFQLKIFFLYSNCFDFWYPVQFFPNVMMSTLRFFCFSFKALSLCGNWAFVCKKIGRYVYAWILFWYYVISSSRHFEEEICNTKVDGLCSICQSHSAPLLEQKK